MKDIGSFIAASVAIALLTFGGCDRSQVDPPQRSQFHDDETFIRAAMEYNVRKWNTANPGKDYRYMAAAGVAKTTNGLWQMEAGPAVIAGRGLHVTVDDKGHLVEIREIFNPD